MKTEYRPGKILFICKANIARSQVASAFFNRLSKMHKSISAGTHVRDKEGELLPKSLVSLMAEVGCDISRNRRKQLTLEMVRDADKIVVLTKKEDLPDYVKNLPGIIWLEVEDWKGKPDRVIRRLREEIHLLIKELVDEIE